MGSSADGRIGGSGTTGEEDGDVSGSAGEGRTNSPSAHLPIGPPAHLPSCPWKRRLWIGSHEIPRRLPPSALRRRGYTCIES